MPVSVSNRTVYPVETRRATAILALIIPVMLLLFLADWLCYQVALPVTLTINNDNASIRAGTDQTTFLLSAPARAIQFAPIDPLVHEYQIDATDSTNNFTLDHAYIAAIANSPYYRFQAWMRDLTGTSHWRDPHLEVSGQAILLPAQVYQNLDGGAQIVLPNETAIPLQMSFRLQLQRPETPRHFVLLTQDNATYTITVDRNDHSLNVQQTTPGTGATKTIASTFLPTDVGPFAAMVFDYCVRILLWALIVLGVVIIGETAFAAIWAWRARRGQLATPSVQSASVASTDDAAPGYPAAMFAASERAASPADAPTPDVRAGVAPPSAGTQQMSGSNGLRRWLTGLTAAVHPIALVALLVSFAYTVWIALAQYHALPHIYDDNAYYFGARMYASGHLSLPIPQNIDYFPGPFMVHYAGRWFTQYPPGTSLALALGIILRVPWLVEPVMGALALLGIGLIAARLFDRRIATLAIVLGTLSPFYTYLTASYMSHTVALFFFVWGTWAFLRFVQGGAGWHMPCAAALFGMAGLTRDLVGLLFIAIVIPGIILIHWRQIRAQPGRWLVPTTDFLIVAGIFLGLSFAFNAQLTGSAVVTPRSIFFPGDRWGFGLGIGFYGQHTLAAGFITLDEILTELAIDLYGWPYYLSLIFLALPFLTLRARAADWFLLIGTVLMAGAWVGYYFHGIYLGPRYLYEPLFFILILTARGIVTLGACGLACGQTIVGWIAQARANQQTPGMSMNNQAMRPTLSYMTIALVGVLIACNLLYFMPRQFTLHQNFTGIYYGYHIDEAALVNPPLHHAVVFTSDYFIYGYTLFSLNDPQLAGNILYAYTGQPFAYAQLHQAFPGRALYALEVAPNGHVTYAPIVP